MTKIKKKQKRKDKNSYRKRMKKKQQKRFVFISLEDCIKMVLVRKDMDINKHDILYPCCKEVNMNLISNMTPSYYFC